MKLLLHTCCAPCSVMCVKNLLTAKAVCDEYIEPHLFWFNPNIHPYSEYVSRRDQLKEFAQNEKLELTVNDEYGLRPFLKQVYPDTDNRCEKCYLMRLEKTASFAAQEGFSAFSTTLLISPYQDHDAVKRIGEEMSAKYGVEFLYRDFRPLFRESQSVSRAKGFYMQKYCGCIFSEEERYSKIFPRTNNNQQCGNIFDRVSLLTGAEGLNKLSKTSALVFGAGGVGSWAAEVLVRSGIGKIGIIDNDTVCASNVNRQLEATVLTLGLAKASALKNRLLEINPQCEVTAFDELFRLENASLFGIEKAAYVIDAIDTINHKLDLIETVCNSGVTLYSSMGMALKTDPSKIKAASIWKTDVCPLARIIRSGLRKRGFHGDFTAVYSSESPATSGKADVSSHVNGSIVTVTGTAGLLLASFVINDVIR